MIHRGISTQAVESQTETSAGANDLCYGRDLLSRVVNNMRISVLVESKFRGKKNLNNLVPRQVERRQKNLKEAYPTEFKGKTETPE